MIKLTFGLGETEFMCSQYGNKFNILDYFNKHNKTHIVTIFIHIPYWRTFDSSAKLDLNKKETM